MISRFLQAFVVAWVIEVLLLGFLVPATGIGAAVGVAGGLLLLKTAAPWLFVVNSAAAALWALEGIVTDLQRTRDQQLVQRNLIEGRTCTNCAFVHKGWVSTTCRLGDEPTKKSATCAKHS